MRTICKAKEEPSHVLFKLREDGEIKFKRVPFMNYFYIEEADAPDCEFVIKNFIAKHEVVKDRNGKEFRKLYLKNNYKRYYTKKLIDEEIGVNTYEADVTAHKRFFIDNQNIQLNQKGLVHNYMDIETYDMKALETDFQGNVIAKHPILSIACRDTEGNVWFERNKALDNTIEGEMIKSLVAKIVKVRKDPDEKEELKKLRKAFNELEFDMLAVLGLGEKELLIKYAEYIKKHDIVFAYNGLKFDYTYLRQRFELHGLDYDSLFVIDFDYMECHKKNTWVSLKSHSLQNVALHEFKDEIGKEDSQFKNLKEVSKVDWKEKTDCKKIFELFLLHPDIEEEYNIQDVNLMALIEQKLKFMKIHEIDSYLSHCPIIESLYSSRTWDFSMLNEYKKRNLISISKPNKMEVERRKDPIHGEFPGGGYTYAVLLGRHEVILCFDFKSFYPLLAVTYNISPDTFVKSIMPDLKLVFNEKEIEYIEFCCAATKEFRNKKGELLKKKYQAHIEAKRKEMDVDHMEKLMWKFVDKYEDPKLTEWLKKNNYVSTPADINFDTRGWAIHPHRVFVQEEGAFPCISRKTIVKRDKVKYELKNIEKNSPEWWEKWNYQQALKIRGNSGYGYFAFKPGRHFMIEIPEGITTAARWTTKKSILFAKSKGWDTTHGDTDSAYIFNETGEYDAKQMEILYYDYFKEITKQFNTACKIELTNPKTGEKELCNHFIVFEHEKTLDVVIVVKKKRYYFKIVDKEGNATYDTTGGMWMKTDTIKIAADLQKELVKDILDDTFDKIAWKKKILDLKKKVYSNGLEKEYLIKTVGVNKPLEEYGKPVIDGSTGKQKLRKSDGKPMFAPIPAAIKVAKKMIKNGDDVEIGDKVQYIVHQYKPRIDPITVAEFEAGAEYDSDYYWDRIISGIIEIIGACYQDELYTYWKECWNYTERQLNNLIEKMQDEDN